jgi:ribonucleotide monophosphatase NagD (HAD superfamily)
MGYGHFVLFQEFEKIIAVYPVMTFGKPESREAFFVNPTQHRYRADATMVGDKTGSDILGTPVLLFFPHVSLLWCVF